MSQRIGFIGLGEIGLPMAQTIVKKGFDLTVYARRKEPLDAMKKLGAKVAPTIKELAELSDIIISVVIDTEQTEVVVLGPEGLLSGAKPGSLFIIMSTIWPSSCQKLHKECASKGVDLICAPITGGPKGAAAGTLSIMVDGDPRLMEKARPVLQAMGKEIYHFGEIGSSQIVKAAKNLISNSQYIAINEAAAMVTKAGIDLELFFEMVRNSTGDCKALHDNWWYRWWVKKHDTPDTIYVTVKDTKQALEVAEGLGLHLEHANVLAKMDIFSLLDKIPRDIIVSQLKKEK